MKALRIVGAFLDRQAMVLRPKHPEPGTAWCEHCSLNGRKTNVMRADKISEHLRLHRRGERISVRIARREPDDGTGSRRVVLHCDATEPQPDGTIRREQWDIYDDGTTSPRA